MFGIGHGESAIPASPRHCKPRGRTPGLRHLGRRPRRKVTTAAWAQTRFSAWSKTMEFGLSIASSVISSPRWAGRSCITKASFAASPMSSVFSWYPGEGDTTALRFTLLAHGGPHVRVKRLHASRSLARVVDECVASLPSVRRGRSIQR